jgi:predicted permease
MILGAFLHSLECILILALLCDAGYVTAARGWYDKNSPTLLARLVTFLSLPAYLFSSVLRTLDHDKLLSLLGSMAVPFISVWTCVLISLVIV